MRQITRWLAKMDAGNFLGSLTDRELEQWRVHVRNNHQPYHRNCKTCVESSGTGRRHVKIKTPSSYCLSLDVCGPFRQRGVDPDHADYRFALIGAYVPPQRRPPEPVALAKLTGLSKRNPLASASNRLHPYSGSSKFSDAVDTVLV